MRRFSRSLASVVISLSLIGTSTAAVARPAPAPAGQVSRWAILSLTSGGAPAAAICGAAAPAAAAQTPGNCVLPQLDMPPPPVVQGALPPPPPPVFGAFGIPIPVLAILAAVLGTMLYIGLRDDDRANSPG